MRAWQKQAGQFRLFSRFSALNSAFFVTFILPEGTFFNICFISMYSALNKLSEYIYSYTSKNITSYTFACL